GDAREDASASEGYRVERLGLSDGLDLRKSVVESPLHEQRLGIGGTEEGVVIQLRALGRQGGDGRGVHIARVEGGGLARRGAALAWPRAAARSARRAIMRTRHPARGRYSSVAVCSATRLSSGASRVRTAVSVSPTARRRRASM